MLFQHGTFLHLDSIDSTNNYAANIQKLTALPEGSVITAQYQVQGRGQRGNIWESVHGENLLFSVVLYPRFLDSNFPFLLSEVVSIALQNVLEEFAGRQMWIKWPNDIICENRKIAGILIEQSWNAGQVQSAIVGIGINVNQVKFDSQRATSLKLMTGSSHHSTDILHAFLKELEGWYVMAFAGKFSKIREAYHAGLFGRGAGKMFRLPDGKKISGIIDKVDEEGMLVVDTQELGKMKFGMKEIAFEW